MAQLINGNIYHYGEKVGEYEGSTGNYNANLGSYSFGGVAFKLYQTKQSLLTAIRKRLKLEHRNWRRKFTNGGWNYGKE